MARRAVSLCCLCRPLVGFSRRTVTQYGDKRRPPPVGKGAPHGSIHISIGAGSALLPRHRDCRASARVGHFPCLHALSFFTQTSVHSEAHAQTHAQSCNTHGYTQVHRRIPHSPTNRARACVKLTLLTSASQQRQVL